MSGQHTAPAAEDSGTLSAPAASGRPAGTRPRLRFRNRWMAVWLRLSPAIVVIGAGFAIPVGFFIVYSFWQLRNYQIVASWTLANYASALTEPVFRHLLLSTLLLAFCIACAATLIALVLASILRLRLQRWQNPIMFLVLVALFSGYLVRIFAWRTLLGDHGVINTVLLHLGVIRHPLSAILYTPFSVVVVLTNFLIPVAVLPCYAALQAVRESEIEAARDLGCSAARAYRRVVLPLAWPGVFVGFAVTFIVASGDYLTPQLVGGPSSALVGQEVANVFLTEFNWPLGAAYAVINLLAVLVVVGSLLVVSRRVVR